MRAEMYEIHHEQEDSHWWYTARRLIVQSLIEREISGEPRLRPPLRILDVGCGVGGLLPQLHRFGSAIGVDASPTAVQYAVARGNDVRLGSLPHELPFTDDDSFDIITVLDVIEHVDDDSAALRALRALLRPHGRMIVTVPAFQFLWSVHDVFNEHRRRYGRKLLRDRLTAAGFEVTMLSYFNSAIFPAVAAIRLGRRLIGRAERGRPDVGAVPRPLNALLHHVFAAERALLGRLPLPFGLSLIAIARRAPLDEPSRL